MVIFEFDAIESDCENVGKGISRPEEEFGVGTGYWLPVATGKTRRRTDLTDACNRGEALSEFQTGNFHILKYSTVH